MTIEPSKHRDWFESLADYMLQRPNATYKEMGRHFGVTPVYVGVVIRSDVFQEALKARREVHSIMVSQTVIQKVEALATQAVEEMSERLRDEKVPLEQVREIGDLALKSLGFTSGRGGGIGAAGAVQQNVTVVVDKDLLADARAKMMDLRTNGVITPKPAEQTQLIDARITEISYEHNEHVQEDKT